MRPLPTLLSIVATVLVASGIFSLSNTYFQSQERTKAEGRLSLYHSSVIAELERFSHLTFVLARDPFVVETTQTGGASVLNFRLESFAKQAGLDAIFLLGADGVTIAASNARQPTSFVGQNYGFRPYFQQALAGAQSRFYGIGATTGLPGYFIADPVRDAEGDILGVIAIKIDLSRLQDSWRASGEQVFLANGDGVVLLSSNPAWAYRSLNTLTPAQRDRIETSRQFPGQPLDLLQWQPTDGQRAVVSGDQWLHLKVTDLPHGWQLHYFASDDRAIALSWLVTGAAILMAGLALILLQVRRARRMGAALARSEQEEIKLRQANDRLAVEIDDRHHAERRLKRTQGELEQASRLAALGQLAASVTHELGQPIAAMRNHLAAAEIGGKKTVGSRNIAGLVDRMEGITRQLKFFAHKGLDTYDQVDLAEAMCTALALVSPNIAEISAQVDLAFPDAPVIIRGNQLRLEQVMTNLLRNALDAMEDSDRPVLSVRLGTSGNSAWFEIQDNGHGLGNATLTDLQEPFVTTRESGRAMGLGLAISATIVKDHGGTTRAWSAKDGGTVFHVGFPTPRPEGEEE